MLATLEPARVPLESTQCFHSRFQSPITFLLGFDVDGIFRLWILLGASLALGLLFLLWLNSWAGAQHSLLCGSTAPEALWLSQWPMIFVVLSENLRDHLTTLHN